MMHYNTLTRSRATSCTGLGREGAWQVLHEVDESIHQLPGAVGGARDDEYQQLVCYHHAGGFTQAMK
jgi:hypothetical protein